MLEQQHSGRLCQRHAAWRDDRIGRGSGYVRFDDLSGIGIRFHNAVRFSGGDYVRERSIAGRLGLDQS